MLSEQRWYLELALLVVEPLEDYTTVRSPVVDLSVSYPRAVWPSITESNDESGCGHIAHKGLLVEAPYLHTSPSHKNIHTHSCGHASYNDSCSAR